MRLSWRVRKRSIVSVELAILAEWSQNEFAFGDPWVWDREDFMIDGYVVIE